MILYFGSEQISRLVTVPTRLFATLLMLLIIVQRGFKKSHKPSPKLLFTLFSFIYLGNVIIDYIFGGEVFESRSSSQIFMYYIIYALVPFYFFSKMKKKLDHELIFKALVSSGIILSIVSIYFYWDILLSGYSRLSMASNDTNFELISPLSLSYSSSLLIGVCVSGILFNNNFELNKKYLLLGIISGLGPFLLGASRGSVLALILPFIFVVFFQSGVKSKFNIIRAVIVISLMMYFLADLAGSTVFTRLFKIEQDIQTESPSAIRLIFWESALQQFSNSPFLGDSIHFKKGNYPHNLIVESLMATGIIGTIPLLLLIGYVVRKSLLIIKYKRNYIWIVIAFWQGFISSMFSYAIYSNIIFYGTLGLMVSLSINKKR